MAESIGSTEPVLFLSHFEGGSAWLYFRKMALDGYVLNLDIPELKEMISLMRYSSNNLNQIAKRVNATGRIYEDDLRGIREKQDKLWGGINQLLNRLGRFQ